MATLAQLPVGTPAQVARLQAPAACPGWARQLEDLGFVPGERVRVLRRACLGGDRLLVRVGPGATVALRGAEAACVQVQP
jgi:ferrous iron transport protein A